MSKQQNFYSETASETEKKTDLAWRKYYWHHHNIRTIYFIQDGGITGENIWMLEHWLSPELSW